MMEAALREALSGEFVPKFLATVSAEGMPNVVPVISIEPDGDDTLIFAELMIWKTKKNLQEDPRVSVAVISDDFRHWTIRGRFEGFETTGARLDKVGGHDMYRYNAYTGPRAAGVIRIQDIISHGKIVTAGAVLGLPGVLLSGAGRGGDPAGAMPPQVRGKFGKLRAGKCLAWPGAEGWPLAVMRFAVAARGASRLVIGGGPLPPLLNGGPVPAALCVITPDPVAYQVKGRITGHGGLGTLRMAVDEVYSASPPIPGKRIG